MTDRGVPLECATRLAVEDDLLDISQGGTKVWIVGGRSILMETAASRPFFPKMKELSCIPLIPIRL